LNDTLKVDYITEAYGKAVKLVEEEIASKYMKTKNEWTTCTESENSLTTAMVERV